MFFIYGGKVVEKSSVWMFLEFFKINLMLFMNFMFNILLVLLSILNLSLFIINVLRFKWFFMRSGVSMTTSYLLCKFIFCLWYGVLLYI